MALTNAQLQALKTHLAANTNTINGTAINAMPNNADANFDIAVWYGGLAQAGDSQPFGAPLLVWRPVVTTGEMAKAIVWSAQPAGADDAARTVAWLKWQSMTWDSRLDMTDTQVRQGIADVWGAGSATETALKATGCGRQAATRAEMVFAGAGVGGARVTPFFGQRLTGSDIEAARNLP